MTRAPSHPRADPRLVAAFLVVALVWGSTWLVIKGQIGTVPPSWSVCWRFALAALGMLALGLARGEIRPGALVPERAVLVRALTIGVVMFCGNFQFVYRAEAHLTSGIVAVVFALLVVPNAILARIAFGTRVTRGFVAGSVIAFSGIALLMLAEARAARVSGEVPLGAALIALALLCASVGNVLQVSPVARRVPAAMLLFWAFAGGAAADFIVAWALSGPPAIDWSARYLGSVAYLALVGSVLTFPLYNVLLRAMGPARAAYNGVLVPVVAMGLSTLFEGYRWSALNAAGAMFALVGLVVALQARNPAR